METIRIPTNKGLQFCNPENIIRVQGLGNYCKIYFADCSHPLTIAKVLHWFEENLPPGVFWRTHKAHLINSRYVTQLPRSGRRYLVLHTGETLTVSRRRMNLFTHKTLCAA